jgi:hypothetical protein
MNRDGHRHGNAVDAPTPPAPPTIVTFTAVIVTRRSEKSQISCV